VTAGYSDHHAAMNIYGQYATWDGWSNGFIGGGELGCNLQYDSFVYGIEGDFSGLTNNAHRWRLLRRRKLGRCGCGAESM
jgi:hypothetical protein